MSDSNERNRDNSEHRNSDGRDNRNASRGDNQRPYQQRNDRDQNKSRPRREGDWKPRRDDDRQPRRDGEWKPRRDDDRQPHRDNDRRPRRDGEDRRPRRDGDWKPRHDDDRKPRREGDWKPRRDDDRRPRRDGDDHQPRREGDWKPRREGDSKPRRDDDRQPRRDGDWKPRRDDDRQPRRDGDWKPRRDDDRQPRREGDWKPRRDDDRKPRRDGDWKPRRDDDRRPRRDGEWKPRRDDDRRPRRDGDERRRYDHDKERDRSNAPRDRKYRGGEGRERSFAETDGNDFRPVRERHIDPVIPEHITEKDLHPGARNELKTLDKPIAEAVAKHLAAVSFFIDDDPELAHQHAISAMRKASRIPVTRETYAITSYVTGDFATALRELRTYRRLTGSNLQLALMIDSERALGRSERAIELGREANVEELPTDVRVQVAIAMSGARLDLGQTLQALYELEIPQLDPKRAYSWSPELFAAYAAVLEDLGRTEESKAWQQRAFAAEEALNEHQLGGALEVFEILEEDDGEAPASPEGSPSEEGERDE